MQTLSLSPQEIRDLARAEAVRRGLIAGRPLGLANLCRQTLSHGIDPWQEDLCRRLESLKPGSRVIIHGPPGCGKTTVIAQRWPVELLAQDPSIGVRLIKFSQERAVLDSSVALGIAREVYPWLDIPQVASSLRWFTKARRDARDAQPSFQAMGLDSGAVGSHGRLWIVDDPYANEQEAYSATVRANISAKWAGMYESRFKDEDTVALMFHRWHGADIAGELIEKGGWEYWRYSAICDEDDDIMGRKIGELLSPRYTMEWLEGRRTAMGSAAFEALFQGRPQIAGGGLLKRAWFKVITTEEFKRRMAPETGEKLVNSAMGGDLAVTAKTSADHTVGLPGAVSNRNNYYWLRPYRAQEEWPDARRALLKRMEESKIRIVALDATGPQKGLVQDFTEWAIGRTVLPVICGADSGKELRVRIWSPIAEQGRIYLVEDGSGWTETWLAEAEMFPVGRFDDQVDAASNLMEALSATVEPLNMNKLGVVRRL